MLQVLQAKLEQLAQQVLRVKRVPPGQQELRALWAKREQRGQQVLRAKQVPLGLQVK